MPCIYLFNSTEQICFGHYWSQRTMSNIGALILSRWPTTVSFELFASRRSTQRCCMCIMWTRCAGEGIRRRFNSAMRSCLGAACFSLSLSSPAGWLHLCGVLRVKDREMWLAKLHSLGERRIHVYPLCRQQRRKVGVRIIQPSRLINL
jgi:hypothetical protein